MKKKDLIKLVGRKKVLKETLQIVDEIGGYDDPELKSFYQGNTFGDLVKIFYQFDDMSDDLVNALSQILEDEDRESTKNIIRKFKDFMQEYVDFLEKRHSVVQTSIDKSSKSGKGYFPGSTPINPND